jgi:hypothetical protein
MAALLRAAIRHCIAGALALAAADAALAQGQVVHHGLSFPERVAGFARGRSHDFEKTHPGLGYSVKYTGGKWFSDIYIYDMRRTSIPDDPKSAVVRAQFEQAEGDIFAQQKAGRYQNVSLRSRFAIADAKRRERMACGAFTLTRDKNTLDSYLCVTSWRNKFVKFRMSVPVQKTNDARAREFLNAWTRLLWP